MFDLSDSGRIFSTQTASSLRHKAGRVPQEPARFFISGLEIHAPWLGQVAPLLVTAASSQACVIE